MSLVGTRPILPDELEQYELHHRARIAIKPGITGMWQVSGRSDITDFEEIVRLDTEYISEWNIGLDIKILFKTVLVPLAIVIALCVLFFFLPEQSNAVLSQIRFFFGDTFGTYYLVIGLGIFILSLYIAGSKYGNIVLGEQNEKPKYSFFAWGWWICIWCWLYVDEFYRAW